MEVGDISGKWIIYAIEEDIDRLWNSIAIMTHQGRLCPSAKVSTNAKNNSFAIMVYINFDDEVKKRAVRNELVTLLHSLRTALRGIGKFDRYKPDLYTNL